MATREQSVRNFIFCMDEVINSNYILASKKISVLLRTIASSKLLYELFDYCSRDFDYPSVRARAIVEGETAGHGTFTMPVGGKNVIAFVLHLLYEIDAENADLTRLLTYCFYDGSFNDSYKRFAREVLIPFKEQTVTAASCMLGSDVLSSAPPQPRAEGPAAKPKRPQAAPAPSAVRSVSETEPLPPRKPEATREALGGELKNKNGARREARAHNFQGGKPKKRDDSGIVQLEMPLADFDGEPKPSLTGEQIEKIRSLLIESKSLILQYKMETAQKSELMELYDEFMSALTTGEPERVKLAFLGYKYTTLYHRKLDASVGKIQQILIDSGIIND